MSARDELMLDSMGPSPEGGFEIKTHAGGPETAETLLFIADSMRSMLDEHDAPNYLEMEVKASDGKNYIMILQRRGKITPHAARLAAEEALEASKPRTITTVEELDALVAGTIIRDPLPCIKWGSGEWGTFSGDSVESSRIDLPATVIYSPEASA
jgi:hypothetical protein